MTITYANGTILKAIVLSHEEDEIRAIASSCDDVLVFSRIHGTWISGEIEPVAIEFAWERRGTLSSTSEDDYVCPKNLASRLIAMLLSGSERDEAGMDTLFVPGVTGNRVATQRTVLLHAV